MSVILWRKTNYTVGKYKTCQGSYQYSYIAVNYNVYVFINFPIWRTFQHGGVCHVIDDVEFSDFFDWLKTWDNLRTSWYILEQLGTY